MFLQVCTHQAQTQNEVYEYFCLFSTEFSTAEQKALTSCEEEKIMFDQTDGAILRLQLRPVTFDAHLVAPFQIFILTKKFLFFCFLLSLQTACLPYFLFISRKQLFILLLLLQKKKKKKHYKILSIQVGDKHNQIVPILRKMWLRPERLIMLI